MGRSVVRQTSKETRERASFSNTSWGGGNWLALSVEVDCPWLVTGCINDQACAAAATAGAMTDKGGVAGEGPWRTSTYCSNREREEMVDDDRRFRQVVKPMDRAQGKAPTGAGEGGRPAGEVGTSREAPGEGGTAASLTVATDVPETTDGIGMVSGVVGEGLILL